MSALTPHSKQKEHGTLSPLQTCTLSMVAITQTWGGVKFLLPKIVSKYPLDLKKREKVSKGLW